MILRSVSNFSKHLKICISEIFERLKMFFKIIVKHTLSSYKTQIDPYFLNYWVSRVESS